MRLTALGGLVVYPAGLGPRWGRVSPKDWGQSRNVEMEV
jgi:hypothetical protein